MRARWIVAATTVALGVGAAAALVVGTGRGSATPSVETLVARAEEFTSSAWSFTYEGSGQQITTAPEGGPFRRVTTRSTLTGAETAGRRRFLKIYEDRAVELIQVQQRAVYRVADGPAALGSLKWQVDRAKKNGSSLSAAPGLSVYFGSNLPGRGPEAKVVRVDKGMPVLRLTVPPDAAPGYVIDYIGYEAELTVSTLGVPQRLVETARVRDPAGGGNTIELSFDIRLSGWGEPVDIRLPPESETRRASGVDNAAIAAYRNAPPLMQPRAIPARWVLDYATVLAPGETTEGCEQLELDYIDPADPTRGYLYLWEFEVACADEVVPPGATEVMIGPNRGWIVVDGNEVRAQFVVGSTIVQAHTDLAPNSLARVLSDLIPLDLTQAPIPIS